MKQNVTFLLVVICFTSILFVCVHLPRIAKPWNHTYSIETDGNNRAIISWGLTSFTLSVNSSNANKTKKNPDTQPSKTEKNPDTQPSKTEKNPDTQPSKTEKNPDTQASKTNVSKTNGPINPGCVTKTISKYAVVDTGKNYTHPNLVHFAKFYKSIQDPVMTLNFREFISVLSVYKFLKPEKLIFHTYSRFSGKYWDKIKKFKNVLVEVNVISPVKTIGGKKTVFVQHQADYAKLSMLYKYGGTALDFDVIMVNGTRWKYLQSKSECVLVEERGVVNGGLYSCIKNSSFIAKWLEGYHKNYKPNAWLYNASWKPLHILQGNVCYNVHVDRTVCLNPTWGQHMSWLKVNGTVWRSKTAIHYYVKEGIPNDGEGLLTEKFSLAEVVQYVYNAK